MASLLQEAVERFLTKDSAGKVTKTLNSLYDVVIDPTIKEGLNTKRVFNSTNLEKFATSKRKDITKLTEDQLDDLVNQYANRGLTRAQKEVEKDIGRKFTKEETEDFVTRFGNELYDTDFKQWEAAANETNTTFGQYLGEMRAKADPGYLGYYNVQKEVLGAQSGIYDPDNLRSLVASNGWKNPEESRAFFEGLKQPEPIDVKYQSNTIDLNIGDSIRAQRADNQMLYASGIISKKEAIMRNKRSIKNLFNESKAKQELEQIKTAASYGDEDALRKLDTINNSSETPWSSTAKAALGTAVAGGALMAALSSSRGQQNNAQLYGQQPIY